MMRWQFLFVGALWVAFNSAAIAKALDHSAQTGTGKSGVTVAQLIASPGAGNPVVAKVNGQEVHRSEVIEFLQTLPADAKAQPAARVYPIVLEQLVLGKLLINAGRAEKLQDDPEVKRRTAELENQVIQDVYVDRLVVKKITPEMVQQRYQKMITETPPQEEVHARHILVAGEAEAKAIIAQLAKGAKFEDLAREKSTDPSAKSSGGDLGYFTHDEMTPKFADAAFALKPGETSQNPVQTEYGFHVIQVLDRRKSQPPSLDEAKPEIITELSKDATANIVKDLRAKAKIERFDINGGPLPDAEKAGPQLTNTSDKTAAKPNASPDTQFSPVE